MSNEAIRNAAALDFAAAEAARAWILTDDGAEAFPQLANQLLRRLDVYGGGYRMAPITAVNGRDVADMARSFLCFPDDVRELAFGSVA